MAAAYDDFECRLRERLLTIAEEIEAAKESGRASMADPANKVGRALAAQQIKIKEAERSRVAAMLAGVQQQQSESVFHAAEETPVACFNPFPIHQKGCKWRHLRPIT